MRELDSCTPRFRCISILAAVPALLKSAESFGLTESTILRLASMSHSEDIRIARVAAWSLARCLSEISRNSETARSDSRDPSNLKRLKLDASFVRAVYEELQSAGPGIFWLLILRKRRGNIASGLADKNSDCFALG